MATVAVAVATAVAVVLGAVAGWRIFQARARPPAAPIAGGGTATERNPGRERPAPEGPPRTTGAAAIAPVEAPEERPHAQKPVPRRAPREPAPAAAVEAAPEAPAPDCAHPFFIDANGIKKLRPECM